MITDTELRTLLADCLKLWDTPGTITPGDTGLTIQTAAATCTIRRGPPPTPWFITTPARTRPTPSIPALLTATRRALNLPPGTRARIGTGAEPLES